MEWSGIVTRGVGRGSLYNRRRDAAWILRELANDLPDTVI